MKSLKNLAMAIALTVAGVMGAALTSGEAFAALCPDGKTEYTHNVAECGVGAVQDPGQKDVSLMDSAKTIINVVLSVVGVIAVVVIIIGGIYFIISQGDAAKITRAKNTILYGVIGLIICLLAFAIVNFVLSTMFKPAP